MFNWIVIDTQPYLELFKYEQTNYQRWTELLVLIKNTWNNLTVCLN